MPGFIAVVCLFAWLDLKLCLYFLIALVCHELGHLLVMRILRIPVRDISLSIRGAVIVGSFPDYGREWKCAAGGPLASFLVSLLCFRRIPELALVSGLLGCLNLLPVYPLDGGRVLRSVLLRRLDEAHALQILRIVTAVVCCLLMIGACWVTVELQAGLWPIFAALVILWRVGNAGWTPE